MHATLFFIPNCLSQIRKEINIPIMVSMCTDFKLWDMGGSVTNILSVIKNNFCYVVFDKNAFCILPQWALCPMLPPHPSLQWCYSVIVYTQHLVMVNSSCFSCCHLNGTIKSKLPTNCFRAKLYSVSNHVLLLPSEPHMVRLLVKSDILKLSGSPQNLLQQMTVCDNSNASLF